MVLTSRPRGKPLPATLLASGRRCCRAARAKIARKGRDICRRCPGRHSGQVPASPSHRRCNATPSMTELKSYDLPELEALAEQIKAEIVKRELEEQERARQAAEAEAEAEAARQAQAAAEAAERAAAEKAAEASRKIAEKKEAAKKETARKAAEKKAAAEAAKEAAREAAQAAKPDAAAPPPAPAVQPEAPHIRYMHPSNRALTWSGEGTMPDWINAWLVTGGTLYALEIAAEKLAPKPIPESFKLR